MSVAGIGDDEVRPRAAQSCGLPPGLPHRGRHPFAGNQQQVHVALVQRVRMMVARNEYKRRQAPPIVRVRARAFGSGRQMPIAARYV